MKVTAIATVIVKEEEEQLAELVAELELEELIKLVIIVRKIIIFQGSQTQIISRIHANDINE